MKGASDMKLRDTVILWNPAAVRKPDWFWVKVSPFPDPDMFSRGYAPCSEGANRVDWQHLSDAEQLARLFALFVRMTAIFGVPKAEAHDIFMEIDEYSDAMLLDGYSDAMLLDVAQEASPDADKAKPAKPCLRLVRP
jgi:hypothetical protein